MVYCSFTTPYATKVPSPKKHLEGLLCKSFPFLLFVIALSVCRIAPFYGVEPIYANYHLLYLEESKAYCIKEQFTKWGQSLPNDV